MAAAMLGLAREMGDDQKEARDATNRLAKRFTEALHLEGETIEVALDQAEAQTLVTTVADTLTHAELQEHLTRALARPPESAAAGRDARNSSGEVAGKTKVRAFLEIASLLGGWVVAVVVMVNGNCRDARREKADREMAAVHDAHERDLKQMELTWRDRGWAYQMLSQKALAVKDLAILYPPGHHYHLKVVENGIAELKDAAKGAEVLLMDDTEGLAWLRQQVFLLEGYALSALSTEQDRKHFLAHYSEFEEGLRHRLFRRQIAEFERLRPRFVPAPTPVDDPGRGRFIGAPPPSWTPPARQPKTPG